MEDVLCEKGNNVSLEHVSGESIQAAYNDLPLHSYLISAVLLAVVMAEIGLLLFALWLNIAEQRRGELPLCLKTREKIRKAKRRRTAKCVALE